MPKGKARKNNPGLYEEELENKQPSMAPQAVAHKRGGTHRVRDEDATGSIYDTFNYKELVNACRDRSIYVKDMKKKEMAHALKNHDDNTKRAHQAAKIERERQEKEQLDLQKRENDKKQARAKARHKRNVEREMRRRCREENVSDDSGNTESEEERIEAEHRDRLNALHEYEGEQIGEVLSDDSGDSTSTEGTNGSDDNTIRPDHKLRLYEWSYTRPPLQQPLVLESPTLDSLILEALTTESMSTDATPPPSPNHELLPVQFRYAPLKVTTTESNQKLALPGQTYPPGVEPDHVPLLSPHTRTAARNGILEGVLRNAQIEKASDWATRTLIQGWNGRMYFNLPSRDEDKDLAQVYRKWDVENRNLRMAGRGDSDAVARKKRHIQRHRNRGRQVVEVYEASRYRPSHVCYIPAYLDYGEFCNEEAAEHDRCLETLFFIRFPSCDVPHYYFWAREGEWSDPTVRNAAWKAHAIRAQKRLSVAGIAHYMDAETGMPCVATGPSLKAWRPTCKQWCRVRRANLGQDLDSTSIVAGIERELFYDGLQATLSRYRSRWLDNGKQYAWKVFSRALPNRYPTGKFPSAPPVEAGVGTDLATKIAGIEKLEADDTPPFSPLMGDESWTRDDDAFWDLVEVEAILPLAQTEDDIQIQLERSVEYEDEIDALHRRSSAVGRADDHLFTWLEQIDPSSPAASMAPDKATELERAQWESTHLDGRTTSTTTQHCPFCSMQWDSLDARAQATHMLSHSSPLIPSTRRRLWTTQQHLHHALQSSAKHNNTSTSSARNHGVDASTASAHSALPRRAATRQRRVSTHMFVPPSTPSSHIPSPFLPRFRRYPPRHPDAAWDPRKRSVSSAESLEFLGGCGGGKRKRTRTGTGKRTGMEGTYREESIGSEGSDADEERAVRRRKTRRVGTVDARRRVRGRSRLDAVAGTGCVQKKVNTAPLLCADDLTDRDEIAQAGIEQDAASEGLCLVM
ncbi:hypothetical protein ACN47E_000250 [Coniothyrium glycines]